jgi:hypothetical protein
MKITYNLLKTFKCGDINNKLYISANSGFSDVLYICYAHENPLIYHRLISENSTTFYYCYKAKKIISRYIAIKILEDEFKYT